MRLFTPAQPKSLSTPAIRAYWILTLPFPYRTPGFSPGVNLFKVSAKYAPWFSRLISACKHRLSRFNSYLLRKQRLQHRLCATDINYRYQTLFSSPHCLRRPGLRHLHFPRFAHSQPVQARLLLSAPQPRRPWLWLTHQPAHPA